LALTIGVVGVGLREWQAARKRQEEEDEEEAMLLAGRDRRGLPARRRLRIMAADELLQDSLDSWEPEMDELDAIVHSRLGASRAGSLAGRDCSAGNVAVMDRPPRALRSDQPEREGVPARRRKGSPGRGGGPPRARGGGWWLAICLLVAGVFAGRAMFGVSASAPSNSARTALSRSAPATTAIETIRVGQRVVTEPGDSGPGGTVGGCHWLRQCFSGVFSDDGSFWQSMNHRQLLVLLPRRHSEVVPGRRPLPIHGTPTKTSAHRIIVDVLQRR